MRKQAIGLFLVLLMILSAPAAFSQKEQPRRLYTYVSQFQVPRAQWAQFAEETEKIADPVFERLMADGTIVSWGDFEAVVHTPDGMTHGSWWQATSFAGILRVLDELLKAGPRPGQIASTKHEDALMHTNIIFAVPHASQRDTCACSPPIASPAKATSTWRCSRSISKRRLKKK